MIVIDYVWLDNNYLNSSEWKPWPIQFDELRWFFLLQTLNRWRPSTNWVDVFFSGCYSHFYDIISLVMDSCYHCCYDYAMDNNNNHHHHYHYCDFYSSQISWGGSGQKGIFDLPSLFHLRDVGTADPCPCRDTSRIHHRASQIR